MKTVLKNRFLPTAALLASVLACSAAHAADKTITAHIVLDSQLGTTAIEDEASADARVVIDAMEDNPDQGAPGAKFTYT